MGTQTQPKGVPLDSCPPLAVSFRIKSWASRVVLFCKLRRPILMFPNCFHISHGKAKKPLIFHGKNYIMETPIPFQIFFNFG
jgi:hypothetical protein